MVLTCVNEVGMNLTTASLTESSPKSISDKNEEATDSNAS